MNGFSGWFDRTSGYALHRIHAAPLSGCCKEARPDGRVARIPGLPQPCPLYQCAFCGRLYARCQDGFLPIDHPLRYQIFSLK
ncbi:MULTISPECIES: hypothetical protein [unclassified Anaerotruncus]|uniref:hypothetical protein n=1 Tax=unclassified Anaerotruncus TaxID=2641626 RepID=UPI0003370560|nr:MULTISPECIES: hypothetical protein [unclassified Anaerotruncus]EOS63935.1 hypothetical protein C814_00669 [Anaerotruncus sp. G3(2012)]NBK17086.1 hypothetical protein [Anaerotruncus sp. 1XD42-93]NCE73913.1 hypothetical protein [Anaerotruncus sp. X29]RKJ98073.1 hypothetical protein D7Y41_05125 [Anaerotruncus sp. 1XD22-93]